MNCIPNMFQRSVGNSLNSNVLPDMSSPTAGRGGSLSLQQKQKMLAESENIQRMSTQPKLTPMSSIGGGLSSKGASTGARDLSSSLMTANLNQLKTSQSFTTTGPQGFNAMSNSNAATTQGKYCRHGI